MADDEDRKKKPKKGGGARTTALAALLAVVAVIAAWLSNCIPGFGIGSSGDAEGEAEQDKAVEAEREQEPEEPEPEPPQKPEAKAEEPAGKTLIVTVDVRGCAVGESSEGPIDCASVCERAELFEGVDDAILEAKEAPHGSVVEMLDCLKAKGIDKVAVHRE